MIVLYLDYLPVMLFGLAAWFISGWIGRALPNLVVLARTGALLAFLSGLYKATSLLLVRGYGFSIDFSGQSHMFFLLLGFGFYYLALCLYSLNRFVIKSEFFYLSRYQTTLYPLLFVLALILLVVASPEENPAGTILISAMTICNIMFVFLSCKLAVFLKDKQSCILIFIAIMLNFTMAALAILMPLENDFGNGYYPNLIREIIFNTLAQGALLWAALRIRDKLFNYFP